MTLLTGAEGFNREASVGAVGDIPAGVSPAAVLVARESYIEWVENNTNRANESE